MTTLKMELPTATYDITVGRGALALAGSLFNLNRRTLVVTDSGVPAEYAEAVAESAAEAEILVLESGEATKSLDGYATVLRTMSEFGMDRGDCVVAVGGGVVGDLAGFAASSYMRGVDFYNVPTTLLSQLDSSIGGKTAINLDGIKNIVGAFYQPRGVIIDPTVLKTLPARHIAAGLAEAVKMSLTSDRDLFAIFEECESPLDRVEDIIIRSLKIKMEIVRADEREGGLRKLLNFGHTLGHGIEASANGALLHGECVALGMLPMCSPELRARLIPVLKKLSLPTEYAGDMNAALALMSHDKKCKGDSVDAVFVTDVGEAKIERIPLSTLSERIRRVFP